MSRRIYLDFNASTPICPESVKAMRAYLTDHYGNSTWVDRYGDYLFRYAMLRLRDRPAAEDMVQETFLAALKDRGTYSGDASEATWLVGILKHKIADHYRSESMDRSLPPGKRIGVRHHHHHCRFCARYERQLPLIRETARHLAAMVEAPGESCGEALSEEARERIRESIRNP